MLPRAQTLSDGAGVWGRQASCPSLPCPVSLPVRVLRWLWAVLSDLLTLLFNRWRGWVIYPQQPSGCARMALAARPGRGQGFG